MTLAGSSRLQRQTMKFWKNKRFRNFLLIGAVPAAFLFWFVTAPAGMAIERIAAGTGNGPLSKIVIRAAEWYESPLFYVDKIPWARRITDSLQDDWCDWLNAPETTP